MARTEAVHGWQSVIAGSIDVLDIPGHHFQAFDEHNVSHPSVVGLSFRLTNVSM